MRIRKNAKLSSILLSDSSHASPQPETLQTHVCQLNQSPWDVITFSQESFQFHGEDSFTGNGSFGDSIGAVESVASMIDGEEDKAAMFKVDEMAIDDNNDIQGTDKMFEDNGHDSRFGREARLRTNGHKEISTGRRGRARATKKGSSSASNPYEFYYYSGFGPLWGKRRGERLNQRKKLSEVKEMENNSHPNEKKTPPSSSSLLDNGGLDYVDDDDDDEDEDEENGNIHGTGKKRMRKPIKARSLKSLM